MTRQAREWVALTTFCDDAQDAKGFEGFHEAGGIYPRRFSSRDGDHFRELVPGEHEAACPRCSQRFATVEDEGTADANRDLHFDGDEDSPSICRNMPTRRLRLVPAAEAAR